MEKSTAVKIDLPIAEIKMIGKPIGARGVSAGKPVDGDGDGICYESDLPRPCPPGVFAGTQLPKGFTAAEQALKNTGTEQELISSVSKRSDKHRAWLRKAREQNPGRTKQGKEIHSRFQELFDDFENYPPTKAVEHIYPNHPDYGDIPKLIENAFTMDGLGDGDFYTDQVDVSLSYIKSKGMILFDVTGIFKDSNGNTRGEFSRDFVLDKSGMFSVVKHDLLKLEEKETRGQGIGSQFAMVSDDFYKGLGIRAIALDAALDDGAYTWARAGYDWQSEEARKSFLDNLSSKLDSFSDEEKPLVIDLIAQAKSEKFDSPNRLTPFVFTLFGGSKNALFKQYWAARKEISQIADMPDLEKALSFFTETKSAVRITAEVVSIKDISIKILPTIASSAKGPGDGKDGDNDGLTDDGTQWERPALPTFIDAPIQELWSRAHQESYDRRVAIATKRLKSSESKKAVTTKELSDAIKNFDEKEVMRAAKQLFEHTGLGTDGSISSQIVEAEIENVSGQPAIRVYGVFKDDSGQKLGMFSRYLYPSGGLDSRDPYIDHDELNLDFGGRGFMSGKNMGIGPSFGVASEIQYARSGYKDINLTAGLSDGPATWAKDGFDWRDEEDRKDFLLGLLRAVNNPSASSKFSSENERTLYRKMIEESLNEDFNDDNRLTPLQFAMLPKFKELAKDANMSWEGTRQVRNYRTQPVTRNMAVRMTGAAENSPNVRKIDFNSNALKLKVSKDDIDAHVDSAVTKMLVDLGLPADATWESHGDEIMKALFVTSPITDADGNVLKTNPTAKEITNGLINFYDGFLNRQLDDLRQYLAKAEKSPSSIFAKFIPELQQKIKDHEEITNLGPREQVIEERKRISQSMTEIMAAVHEQITRHPQLKGKITLGIVDSQPSADVSAAMGSSIIPVLNSNGTTVSHTLAHSLQIGSAVIGDLNLESFITKIDGRAWTVGSGFDSKVHYATVQHEIGHALAADAYLQRMGFSVDEGSEPLLDQIKKQYPKVNDSILVAIAVRQHGYPYAIDSTIDDLPLVPDTQRPELNQMHILDALSLLTADMTATVTQPDGSEKEDFRYFSLDNGYMTHRHAITAAGIENNPSMLATINRFYSGFDFTTDYQNHRDTLQALLYSVNNDQGPAEVFFGNKIDKATEQIKGLSPYGDTSVSEFLAEAHSMIESLESIPNAQLTTAGKDALKNIRALYEAIMNPDGKKFNLKLDSETQREVSSGIRLVGRIEDIMMQIAYR